MKKLQRTLLTIFCTTVLWSCDQFSVADNTLRKMNLKGSIKSFKETEYAAEDKIGQIVRGEARQIKYYVFNKNGNRTEASEYSAKGDLREKILFFYDDKQQLTENRKVFGLSRANIMDYKPRELNEVLLLEYHYDSTGKLDYRLTKDGSYEATQFTMYSDSMIYQYNTKGILFSTREYKAKQKYFGDGKEVVVEDVIAYTYNEDGLVLTWVNGSEVYEDKSIAEEGYTNYLKKNPAATRFDYLLRQAAKQAERGNFIRFDTLISDRYTYKNKLPSTLVTTYIGGGENPNERNYAHTVYNQYGDPITKSNSTSDITRPRPIGYDHNKIETYSYEYNEYNNWVTKIVYSNGIVENIFERTYEYY